MALEADLQAVVDDLTKFVEPADADALKAIFEKNKKLAQEVKDGRLRQSDYSKFLNENKQKLADVDKWSAWANENIPRHEKLVDQFSELQELNKTLETQVADYRDQVTKFQAGELNVDEAALDARVEKRVKDLGYVTQAEMQKIIKQEAGTLATEAARSQVTEGTTKFLTETWPAVQAINQAIIMKSFSHMKEFGEPLNDDDVKAISDIMVERNLQDPRKAYDAWVTPKRDAIKFESEVQKRVTELRSNDGFPGVSGQPMMELGPVQLKNAGKIPELPADSKLGDNNAAMAAAAEMRTEGKY